MKTKVIITIMLGLFAVAFIFKETSKENSNYNPLPPSPGGNDFIVGAMDCGIERDYNNKNSLNVNLWHRYTGVKPGSGWPNISNDNVWVDPNDYANDVSWRINRSYDNGLFTFYDRPKWYYLAYGQRSDYQADVDSTEDWDKLWWQSYKVHVGERIADNQFNGGQRVLHVSSIESGPGAKYVLKNLYGNREQSVSLAQKASRLNQDAIEIKEKFLDIRQRRILLSQPLGQFILPSINIRLLTESKQLILHTE